VKTKLIPLLFIVTILLQSSAIAEQNDILVFADFKIIKQEPGYRIVSWEIKVQNPTDERMDPLIIIVEYLDKDDVRVTVFFDKTVLGPQEEKTLSGTSHIPDAKWETIKNFRTRAFSPYEDKLILDPIP